MAKTIETDEVQAELGPDVEPTNGQMDDEEFYSSISDCEDRVMLEAEADWRECEIAEARYEKEQRLRDKHFANLAVCDKQLAEGTVRYPEHEYLVDVIFPRGEVHVLTGESGVGKTSWMFDFIDDWQHERDVLGRKSHWQPYCILVNDRSKGGMQRTLERLGKHPAAYDIRTPKLQGKSQENPPTIVDKVAAVIKSDPNLRVIFIEGLQVEAAESNDYGAMSRLMSGLNGLCQRNNITIIATTHTSKMNAASGGVRRTAIIGSAATPAMCETVLVFTEMPGFPGYVRLTVQNHNGPKEEFYYRFTDKGRLEGPVALAMKKDLMAKFIESLPEEVEEFARKQAVTFFIHNGSGEAGADKKLSEAVTAGFLGRQGRGQYVILKRREGWQTLTF